MKTRLLPQQKKKHSYAKDRRNVYGERGSHSRHAIRENKLYVERSRRHTENQVLQEALSIKDGELLATVDDEVKSQPSSKKRFHKMPDAPLGQVVKGKLARREMHRVVADQPAPANSSPPSVSRRSPPPTSIVVKNRDAPWRLAPNEVGVSLTGGGSFGRTNYKIEMKLEHLPTGISVSAESAKGDYTRAQASVARNELYAMLIIQLEEEVAAYLRIPGRTNSAN